MNLEKVVTHYGYIGILIGTFLEGETILGFRFLYGIRTVAPFILGTSGISPFRYLVLNITGALIWAIVIGMLGYYFGYAIEILIGEIKQYEELVILGLVLVGTAVWILFKWRERSTQRKAVCKAEA